MTDDSSQADEAMITPGPRTPERGMGEAANAETAVFKVVSDTAASAPAREDLSRTIDAVDKAADIPSLDATLLAVRSIATAAESAKLEHPYIVPIHEVGEHNKQHYYSMGYVDGPSLSKLLHDGRLATREAADLLAKTADAVQYAHEQGTIHRDLKPANILLQIVGTASGVASGIASGVRSSPAIGQRSKSRPDSRTKSGSVRSSGAAKLSGQGSSVSPSGFIPKVTDFGLAKRTAEGDSSLTASGAIVGTPSYRPPAQAAGRIHDITVASDVYSLGAKPRSRRSTRSTARTPKTRNKSWTSVGRRRRAVNCGWSSWLSSKGPTRTRSLSCYRLGIVRNNWHAWSRVKRETGLSSSPRKTSEPSVCCSNGIRNVCGILNRRPRSTGC